MCGIVGRAGKNLSFNQSELSNMINSINHRGPDFSSNYKNEYIQFYHNRLSIIDLESRSNQPMICEESGNIIIYNGEIYNFIELRNELKNNFNCKFKTKGDTEVLLKAYNVWGKNCLNYFDGMFSFAIYDKKKNHLFIARDRLGEKPLFYYFDEKQGFIFASELKCFLKSKSIKSKLSLNLDALNEYLCLNYCLFDKTFFKEIKTLNPSSYIEFNILENTFRIGKYWNLIDNFKNKTHLSYSEAKEKLEFLLNKSIRQRSITDVSNGIYLSGGVDSSIISINMKKNKKISDAHHLKFKEENFDESGFAQILAKENGLPLNVYNFVDENNLVNDFSSIIECMDQPMSDTAFLSNYYLSKYSVKKSKVVLSGDGGDELFAGYPTYKADFLKKYLFFIKYIPKDFIINISDILTKNSKGKIPFNYKIIKFFENINLDSNLAHVLWRSIFSENEKADLLKKEFLSSNIILNQFSKIFEEINELNYLDKSMYIDLITWFPNDILYKVDRTSMFNSQETRLPLTSKEIVEFACKIPSKYKFNYFNQKKIFKDTFLNKKNKKILERNKTGFGSPINLMLCNSTKFSNMVNDLLSTEGMLKLFDNNKLNQMKKNNFKVNPINSYKIFNLICLSQWMINNRI